MDEKSGKKKLRKKKDLFEILFERIFRFFTYYSYAKDNIKIDLCQMLNFVSEKKMNMKKQREWEEESENQWLQWRNGATKYVAAATTYENGLRKEINGSRQTQRVMNKMS